jgi:hypothetical protein
MWQGFGTSFWFKLLSVSKFPLIYSLKRFEGNTIILMFYLGLISNIYTFYYTFIHYHYLYY